MHKKIIGWIATAFVAFYVITQPAHSAAMARRAGVGIASFANALVGGER